MTQMKPSELLLEARRKIDSIKNYRLISDFTWDSNTRKWVLKCRLSIASAPTEYVPQSTDWYILVDENYPCGEIEFYPASKGGLIHTFQHQALNAEDKNNAQLRTGKICLFESPEYPGGPKLDRNHEEDDILLQHVMKALDWLEDAAKGTLAERGEYYELPEINYVDDRTICFKNGETRFEYWEKHIGGYGKALYRRSAKNNNIITVKEYSAIDGSVIANETWGDYFENDTHEYENGIWILAKDIPVIKPWKIPQIWSELRSVLDSQSLGMDSLIRPMLNDMRDLKAHILMIGFPIPERIGEVPSRIHWLAVDLPILSNGQKYHSGFRKSEEGYWQRDRRQLIDGPKRVSWVRTENCSWDVLSSRGGLKTPLRTAKCLVIGVGAIGSVVSELLVRGGVEYISVADCDVVSIGNLTRHILNLNHVRKPKSSCVSDYLRSLSMHVIVREYKRDVIDEIVKGAINLNEFDCIIDCTANDDVLKIFEEYKWSGAQNICSISMTYEAKMLIVYCELASKFKFENYKEKVVPQLTDGHSTQVLSREGVGCWHNVFPAKGTDVYILAAKAVNILERWMNTTAKKQEMYVYENAGLE